MLLLGGISELLLLFNFSSYFGILRQVLLLVDFDPIGHFGENVVARSGITLSLEMHVEAGNMGLRLSKKLAFVFEDALRLQNFLETQIIEECQRFPAKLPDIEAFDGHFRHAIREVKLHPVIDGIVVLLELASSGSSTPGILINSYLIAGNHVNLPLCVHGLDLQLNLPAF